MNYKLYKLNVHGDNRGKLVALESNLDIPFEIKRAYWIFDTLPEEKFGTNHSCNRWCVSVCS